MDKSREFVVSCCCRGVGEMLIAALGYLAGVGPNDLRRVVDKPMAGIKGEGTLTSGERIEIVAQGFKSVGGVHRYMMGRSRCYGNPCDVFARRFLNFVLGGAGC